MIRRRSGRSLLDLDSIARTPDRTGTGRHALFKSSPRLTAGFAAAAGALLALAAIASIG